MKLFIALLFALIVASAHTGEAATRFLFAYGAIGGNAMPLWIAQEQGIFRKYNLEPQLVYIIVLPLRDRAMSQPLSRLHAGRMLLEAVYAETPFLRGEVA